MRKMTILSVVATSLLLIGCGQDKPADTKAEPVKTEAQAPTKTETVVEKATKAVEAVKDTASAAVEKTTKVAKEATKNVAEKATKAVEATKEAASVAVAKTAEVAKDAKAAVVAATTDAPKAPAVFAKCAGCHGKDGKTKALGKSAIIAGQSKADLIKKIDEYKAGTRNVSGMGGLMKGQVASLSDADIDAIATYVSGLK